MTVVYKVLPPRTSDGMFVCKGLFNKIEIVAPSLYTQWDKGIELGTQRSLTLTLVDVSQETDHRRRKRCTETIPPMERVVLTTSYILEKIE